MDSRAVSFGEVSAPCVGRLEIANAKKPVGFLCGTIPVPTDAPPLSQSSGLPSPAPIGAPRYQKLPAETDLNTLPLLSGFRDSVFPTTCYEGDGEYLHCESTSVAQNLSRKCETLAMCGLVECEDEIDVVAPTDILKQIFKMPYSKSQLSIAVHRIGNTLILNTGPDFEEGEKIYRRKSNQSKGSDPSILLNFAMHSVRAEACDCPPTHIPSSEMQSSANILHGQFGCHDDYASSTGAHVCNSQYINETAWRKYPQGNCDRFFWGTKQNNQKHKKSDSNRRRSSQVGEKPKCPVQESEKYRRAGDNSFLRVFFWQFHNFRMFLGSDLLLFSNEKYVAVSLHLWDVSRQVTPITWLEAWLDNVMASVPELAICYHRNGVVQGYELLKTSDIFLLKGVADDGAPAFNPHIVEKHGLSVLKFLQSKCKQDPGAYWLYRSAGEDVIQLFDLSILSKNHAVDDRDKSSSSFLSLLHKGRRESLFTLGTLLYRVAHRLSLSKASHNRARCAKFLEKCLNFLNVQDHLVIRAFAHEQFARLILKCYEELDLTSESFLLESEVTVIDLEDESAEFSEGMFENVVHDKVLPQTTEAITSGVDTLMLQCSEPEALITSEFAEDVSLHSSVAGAELDKDIIQYPPCGTQESMLICQMSETVPQIVRTIAEPISSKLAAIHHVSQAIKALRWKRQLQNTEGNVKLLETPSMDFSLCACGDVDCIEICGIREWLAKSKIDRRMWNLVLLLGESYLALSEAYKEDGQLHQALKVVELASLVYGSMPLQLEDAQFISSIVSDLPHDLNTVLKSENKTSVINTAKFSPAVSEQCSPPQISSNYLFWSKAWELVGDVYVEYYRRRTTETLLQESKRSGSELRMSNEVMREVKRLKKKLGQHQKNCSTCSLVNCSCQSDRASSGSSASSSNRDATRYNRKLSKKSSGKSSLHSDSGISKDDSNLCEVSINPGSEQSSKGCMHTPLVGMYSSSQSSPPFYSIESEDNCPKRTFDSEEVVSSEPTFKDTYKMRHGGIFKYLDGPKAGEAENNLFAAINCYHSAVKALDECPKSSCVIHSIVKKKGWVFNELGRYRIEKGNLAYAEVVFREAIKAFKEVSDPTNIILINCNLGHGRRAVAEEMLSGADELRMYDALQHVYKKKLKTAKTEYAESLKYYGAAKTELMSAGDVVDISLHNEVYTQYAHTYLRLGMLLAKESLSKEDNESGLVDEFSIDGKLKEQLRPEMTTGDALREALSIYESLGGLRKQEAAFTYFQLACYHRDCCIEFLNLNKKQINLAKHDKYRQKAKWYASLAEKNWKKSAEFYGPRSHPIMYLDILLELSNISLKLSNTFYSHNMLETALDHLLEGRHVDQESEVNHEIIARFWKQLQSLLKSMLTTALSSDSSRKSGVLGHGAVPNKAGDALKLREMYRVSLKSTAGLGKLLSLYNLWNS